MEINFSLELNSIEIKLYLKKNYAGPDSTKIVLRGIFPYIRKATTVTLAGHVTCTWFKTDVSFTSCHIILFAVTPTNSSSLPNNNKYKKI